MCGAMDPTAIKRAGIQKGGDAAQICAVLPAPLLRLPCTVLRELLPERALLNWGKDACRVI